MVLKKIIFQNRYVALEIGLDPPHFMANAILNFHFDFLNTSLTYTIRRYVLLYFWVCLVFWSVFRVDEGADLVLLAPQVL